MERAVTLFSSAKEAAQEERRQDEALTPEERLQTAWELSVLAYGPPTPIERVYRLFERPRG